MSSEPANSRSGAPRNLHIQPTTLGRTEQETFETVNENRTCGYGGLLASSPANQSTEAGSLTSTINNNTINRNHGRALLTPLRSNISKPRRQPSKGAGFTHREVNSLLETLLSCLPILEEEWDVVLTDQMKGFSSEQRKVDILRRNFSLLHRKKMSTGDPLIPDDVRKTKHIRYLMTEIAERRCGEYCGYR